METCEPLELTRTSPEVRWSTPVIILSNVDFPAPDLPMIPTNSPLPTCMLMPLSALNSPAAVEYTFTTSTNSTKAEPLEELWRDEREAGTDISTSFLFLQTQ